MPLRTLASALLLVAALAGCGDDEPPAPSGGTGAAPAAPSGGAPAKRSVKVAIDELEYQPPAVRVKAGGTVTWTNVEPPLHTAETVGTQPAGFDTGRLEEGDAKRVRFEKPGTYRYICGFHAFMKGTVEVEK